MLKANLGAQGLLNYFNILLEFHILVTSLDFNASLVLVAYQVLWENYFPSESMFGLEGKVIYGSELSKHLFSKFTNGCIKILKPYVATCMQLPYKETVDIVMKCYLQNTLTNVTL